jgi:acyl-CoA synthetase (AMP-forming)/AMP-acid ligase II
MAGMNEDDAKNAGGGCGGGMPGPPSSSGAGDGATASTPNDARRGRMEPNSANDEVLVLFTSGTTGSKKLVPHVMGDMLTAAATIALSWDLSPSDVNCNLMPLFHVGGIVRQIFSPVFSGGCVICCPNFDPSTFWALLAKRAFTWYYAAPTMHQLILSTGKSDGMIGEGGECSLKLRMIANAAGGLLPSLAKEMYQVFDATVSSSSRPAMIIHFFRARERGGRGMGIMAIRVDLHLGHPFTSFLSTFALTSFPFFPFAHFSETFIRCFPRME